MPDQTRTGIITPAVNIDNLQDGSGKLATRKRNLQKSTENNKMLDMITTVRIWNVSIQKP